MLLQLKRIRHNFDGPVAQWCILSSFEAEEKESGVLGVYAERVHATFGIRLAVCFEPFFWVCRLACDSNRREDRKETYRLTLLIPFGIVRHSSSR
jgi:hypothetical protein